MNVIYHSNIIMFFVHLWYKHFGREYEKLPFGMIFCASYHTFTRNVFLKMFIIHVMTKKGQNINYQI
jgi:hypothetical protein